MRAEYALDYTRARLNRFVREVSMGEALDKNGNLLGVAEGATKRDVFEQLMAAHPDAEEIRIGRARDLEQKFRAVEEKCCVRDHDADGNCDRHPVERQSER